MKTVQCAGLLIDVIELCYHGNDIDVACDECAERIAKLEPGVDKIGGGRYGFGYTVTPTLYVRGDHLTEGNSKRFVVCPHGERVPLRGGWMDEGNVDLPRATKYKHWCPTCEEQRAEGRAQEDAVKALLKTLPRQPRVRKSKREKVAA